MKTISRSLAVLAAGALFGACAASQNPQPATAAGAMSAPIAFDSAPAVGAKATCPVMKKTFTVSAESKRSEHDGKHYAFCCPGCKGQFDANPAKFLAGKAGPATANADSNVPMGFAAPPKAGSKARCPVSGSAFPVSEGSERSEHDGKHYAFCCKGCKAKFDADPAKFLSKNK